MFAPFNDLYGHRPENHNPVFLLPFFLRNMSKGFANRIRQISGSALIILLIAGSLFAQSGKFSGGQIVAQTDDIFSTFDNWIKIGFSSTGVQLITYADLTEAGIDLSGIDPRTLRIFYSGGKQLDPTLDASPAHYQEMAIYVEGTSDVSFDEGDYIIVYAPSASRFEYNPDNGEIEYLENHYSVENYVYLTYGPGLETSPLRMETVSVADTLDNTSSIFSFTDKKRFEQNELLSEYNNTIFDYYNWYYINDDQFEMNINIDNLSGFGLSKMKMGYKGRDPYMQIKGFDPSATDIDNNAGVAYFWSDAFSSNLNQLSITINPNIRSEHYLDYLELEYLRRLQYAGGSLGFYGQRTPGEYRYRVVGITDGLDYTLLDISDIYNQKILSGANIDGENRFLEFDYENIAGEFSQFALTEEGRFSTPSSLEIVAPEDILNPGQSYDLIVVAPAEFMSAFGAYRTLRQADGYSVYLASTEDIYAYFSGGQLNPSAIRNFLYNAFQNWPRPAPGFVILGGDGAYDFLGNSGTLKDNFVPPYIAVNDSSISDENYILFSDEGWLDSDASYPADRGVDMVAGRWPVRTASEVADYIAKLAIYESGANNGRWQNLLTFVADDEVKPGTSYPEREHTEQSETLANLHSPGKFDQDKIYLIDYPINSSGEKPGAKEKLINAINTGSLLVNFIGHGNLRLWTDERIFRTEDIASLDNEKILPVILTASCSIGEYDSPFEEGMAEQFFRYSGGGAIAVIAATRLVYSSDNARYNYKCFDVLFGEDDYTLCEAMYVAKMLRQIEFGIRSNDRRYILFGDPLMKLAVPKYNISFQTENIDTLAALNLLTVAGEVQDEDGMIISDFEGSINVSVFDDQINKFYRIFFGATPYDIQYTAPGARVYRGTTDVQSGQFNLQFMVPKDISYGGDNARISAYADQNGIENLSASGALDSIVISGSIAEITDTLEPEINLYLDLVEITDGLLIPQRGEISVELYDSSGINLSGEVGHRLELNLNDDPRLTYDLTELFSYETGSYQRGTVVFALPEIEDGNYTLKVKAWDSANNSAQKVYNISIGAVAEPQIVELYNVPNPFSGTTQFYYELSAEASDVSLDLYTLSGRKIHTLQDLPGRSGENLTDLWDGTDGWGDKLANGVYIYKLNVRTAMQSADKNLKKFGKIVILK